MKTVLVLIAVLAVVSANDMRQRLLSILESLEKRGPSPATPTAGQTGSTDSGNKKPIEGISLAEFRSTVDTWGEQSKEFTNSVKSLKPMILNTLTRTQDWESVNVKFEEILSHGEVMYHTILLDILQLGQKLFDSKETPGFSLRSKCSSVSDLSETYDPETDTLAEVKVIEAMVSDLDCFNGEIRDITQSFDTVCMGDGQLSIDKALDMLGEVMKYLYRFKIDGEKFGLSAKHMGEIVAEKYQSMNQ